ncbi:hypothetical protein SGRA_0395 [Saprospira grandis str. Lewin]|uniref:Uncharacterized protein n=1 Tax=Saprospira grandis (strain Lewin) TaxID=984262 RepID=H6L8Z8_SAPGL|nr:hypothetical protein SGRA_0395 [Saprospira grandis str. Lewin]
MNRFLLKLIIFITPILLLMVGLEIALRSLPNDYKTKWKGLEEKEETLENLVLGSSHAFNGIRPALLGDNSYSMAYYSQNLYYDCMIFEKKERKI